MFYKTEETEESQAYDRNCAHIFQMNNGSSYTNELSHKFDYLI